MKIEKVFSKRHKEFRYKINVTIDGKQYRRSDFRSAREAKEAISAMISSARAARYGLVKPMPKITLGQFLKAIEDDESYTRRARLIFRQFVEKISGENMPLLDLKELDWHTYRKALIDKAPGTINTYLATVSGILSSAPQIYRDLDGWRPPRGVYFAKPEGRQRLLSNEEIKKILEGLRVKRQPAEQSLSVNHRRRIADLFVLMLLTGARKGELLNLEPDQISRDWKTMRLTSIKGSTGASFTRVIPLSGAALRILDRIAPDYFLGYTDEIISRALRRAAELAGVPYGDRVPGGWVIYDLRHLAATVMEHAGLPYSIVSAILGHKRRDMTARYTHAPLEVMRRGTETLERFAAEFVDFDSGILTGFDSESGQNRAL